MRYRQAVIVVKFLFLVLILGLFYIQIIRGNYYYNLSRRNTIRVVSREASRGKILDRNGVILADTIPSFDIYVIPQEIKDKDALFSKLSEFLDTPVVQIERNYKKNYLNPFIPVQIYERLDKERVIILEENKLKLPGVIIEIRPQRNYPFGGVASHVLGYLGQIDTWRITQLKPYGYELSDLVGYGGVEEYYDLMLRGKKGGEQVEVDNLGRRVRTVGYKSPKPGQDIQLTIDVAIQKITDKFMDEHKGAVIIIEPFSGEIIALGSYPNYNPNDFIKREDFNINSLLNDDNSPLLNRAVAGQYPPGSVFKVVTAVGALENETSFVNKSFICDGNLEIGNRVFECWSIHGQQNLRDAVVHSCNIYFYKLGLLLKPEVIKKYALILGLGKKTGIDLKYEKNGFIPSPEWKKIMKFQNWYKGDTANMSIGQGDVMVTPLQLTKMASMLANGGRLIRPHLIKAVGERGVIISKNKSINISNFAFDNITHYLNEVVEDIAGTAHITKIEGLRIFGKTGTAQVYGKQSHGWLVGYVGRDRPKYAFCVFLEHGGSSHAACMVAKKILEEMFKDGLI